jgi:hypothetical protein
VTEREAGQEEEDGSSEASAQSADIRGSQSWESTSILTSILALIPASIFDQESTPESMFSGIDAESMFRLRRRNSMRINSRIGPGGWN